MKMRWQRFVRDYLTFSAKDRWGVALLLLVIGAVFLLIKFYSAKKSALPDKVLQQELANLNITIDSSKKQYQRSYGNRRYNNYDDYDASDRSGRFDKKEESTTGELFAFDPNTLDAAGWKRLGVRDKTITTIQRFREKGYRFRKPEDLGKIYGFNEKLAERLIPYVQIAGASPAATDGGNTAAAATTSPTAPAANNKPFSYKTININNADTAAFIALPGIGSKLANRIVGFRERLGGFVSVDQMGETFGLPDSTFQKLKSRLECNNPVLRKLSINALDAAQLKQHPYIRWNIANAIVNYRAQHGNFKSLEDLKKIDLITEDLYAKLLPYLML